MDPMVELQITTGERIAAVDITSQVNGAVQESGLVEGLCNIFVRHTTAAVIVSENWDLDVVRDLLAHLQKLVPQQAGYRHAEGNSQAHILSALLGTSLNIPVKERRLWLGRWQGVMLAEFDGPRRRSVVVSFSPKVR
ncbi:MAG: secondary thiamine-phosphate synthase enzyme YjbQ [Deltaproteobacteria bacterium]|jgi:secondary thiamine-phosphate synthase enzyme|nr:secondary thiamine-phosphate synthase enzyme YjbQ [Deltaproteobacteria bacterium]